MTRAMVVEVMQQRFTTILIRSNKVAMNGSITFYLEPFEIRFEYIEIGHFAQHTKFEREINKYFNI